MKHLMMILFLLAGTGLSLLAQQPEVYRTKNGAINGYDPVAYFKEGKAVRGKDEFKMDWNNATWRFDSKASLDSFKTDPKRFAPQYGGYCAYGTAGNHKAPTDAEAWKIINDKLYLNYSKDVQKEWLKSPGEQIIKADANWPGLKDK